MRRRARVAAGRRRGRAGAGRRRADARRRAAGRPVPAVHHGPPRGPPHRTGGRVVGREVLARHREVHRPRRRRPRPRRLRRAGGGEPRRRAPHARRRARLLRRLGLDAEARRERRRPADRAAASRRASTPPRRSTTSPATTRPEGPAGGRRRAPDLRLAKRGWCSSACGTPLRPLLDSRCQVLVKPLDMSYVGVKRPEEYSMTIEATVDGQLVRWRDSKRYLWLLGAVIPLIPMAMWGLVRLDRLDAVVVLRAVLRVRDHPDLRPPRRARPEQPARRDHRGARGGPVLPLDHLRVHPAAARRLRLGLPTCSAAARCPASRSR